MFSAPPKKRGLAEGLAEGLVEGQRLVVAEMKKQGLDVQLIAQYTGFTPEEIEHIL